MCSDDGFVQTPTNVFCTFYGLQVSSSSLVPSLHTPPSKKWSGELSWIFLAYYPKVVKTISNYYVALPLQVMFAIKGLVARLIF